MKKLEPTDEMIARAKAFCLKKWIERYHERYSTLAAHRPDLIPVDLSDSCKFTSLFAQQLFGGVLKGNYQHQYLLCHDKKIDLNHDAADVIRMGKKAHRHDEKFFGNVHHQSSLDSCMPRVNAWVKEFLETNHLMENVLNVGFPGFASTPDRRGNINSLDGDWVLVPDGPRWRLFTQDGAMTDSTLSPQRAKAFIKHTYDYRIGRFSSPDKFRFGDDFNWYWEAFAQRQQ